MINDKVKYIKRIIVLLCIIFITSIVLWLCLKGKSTIADNNKPSSKAINNEPNTRLTTPNTARLLRLDEIELSVHLTKEQVVAKWGPPDAIEGSGVEYLVYKLDDGRYLGLKFASQEPHPLLTAIITDESKKESKIIFDGMKETKLR